MAISPKQAIKDYYVRLITEVPLDNTEFFALAKQAGLFPLGTGANVEARKTKADKMTYLLNDIVEPGADDYLPILLQVMKKSKVHNVVKLADEIQAALNGMSYVCMYNYFY